MKVDENVYELKTLLSIMSAIGKRNNLAEEEEVVNGEMEEVGLEDVDEDDAKETMTMDNYIKKWSTVYQFDVKKVHEYIENNIKDQPGLCLSTWMLLDMGVRLYFRLCTKIHAPHHITFVTNKCINIIPLGMCIFIKTHLHKQ